MGETVEVDLELFQYLAVSLVTLQFVYETKLDVPRESETLKVLSENLGKCTEILTNHHTDIPTT